MDQFATIVEDYLLSDPLTKNEDLMVRANFQKSILQLIRNQEQKEQRDTTVTFQFDEETEDTAL